MFNDLRGKAVLITGGTAGIGLATGLAFGRRGAHCTLTYHWGSADEDEVRDRFAEVGAPTPRLVQADAAAPASSDEIGRFDRILLDVPCSGLGVIRRHPDIRLRRRSGEPVVPEVQDSRAG